jgi:hypothetical protein
MRAQPRAHDVASPVGSPKLGPGRELADGKSLQSFSFTATPAGFEGVPNITRPRVEGIDPKQDGALGEVTSGRAGPICNDCNEVTPRLARVAKNALLNGDFPRVLSILDRLSVYGPKVGVSPTRHTSPRH